MSKQGLKISPYHLIEGFERWIRRDNSAHILREGLNIRADRGSTTQIYTFKARSLEPQEVSVYSGDFSVLTVNGRKSLDQVDLELAHKKLEQAYLENKDGGDAVPFYTREFLKIFSTPVSDRFEMHCFGDKFSGTRIISPINAIPLGKNGRISENLYFYGEVGIAKLARS